MVRAASCLVVCALAAPARADNPPIVDSNYAIDLYDGVAIGDTAMIGMGGAGAALINGTAGTLINPSALAVRQTTDLDSWGWSYHLDVLTGRYSSDYDNNGVVAEDSGAALLTGGLGLRIHDWSVGLTYLTQSSPLPGSSPKLTASATKWRLILADYLPEYDLAAGVGIQFASFGLAEGGTKLFEVAGSGLIAGATWLPRDQDVRIGGSLDLAITGGQVNVKCDPDPMTTAMTCNGHILPDEVDSPPRLVGGIAYRIGPTPWNQTTYAIFRDERAVTLAADVVVTGPTSNGYGIEAFGMGQLQRSGASAAISLRGGAEYEWLPGKLRVRGGAYWEPPRFDGVNGRLHATFGAELAVFEFHLRGLRRLQVSFTGDVAARYRNVGLAIGFWR
ncbi:MAG TPA: hypothetical protein VFK02_02895 [Kofleriaceae bacterium]|nr:hypothetical protein [Kofleriaceae bacterium]